MANIQEVNIQIDKSESKEDSIRKYLPKPSLSWLFFTETIPFLKTARIKKEKLTENELPPFYEYCSID